MFGKQALIDFVIRLQGRVVYLEVKYGIPQLMSGAFMRLERQLSLSLVEAALAGEGEVILFAAAERAAAERLLVGALAEDAGAVEIVNGMIELFNVLRGIFWI